MSHPLKEAGSRQDDRGLVLFRPFEGARCIPIYQRMWGLWALAFRRPCLMEKERWGGAGWASYSSTEEAAGRITFSH